MDKKFTANSLSPEQLRQMQNIAALAGQGLNNNLGLLGINPMALQNLLNPLLANSMATNSTNQTDSTSGLSTCLLPNSNNQLNQRNQNQLQQTIRLIKQQQQRQQHQQQRQQHQQQHQQQQQQQQQHQQQAQQQQQQQQLIQQEFTQRLQQQLQQIVQQSQRQQTHPSFSGDATSLTTRQPQPLSNPGPSGQQKRKRGRPPLSGPSSSASSSAVDYNYLNMFAAIKNQQDGERMQRESKLQQDRQREMRQQQEHERQRELKLAQERAERQQEIRAQQERERQRAELERQRKAHHRLALQDIDRERRRQHMMMVKNLDAYKRNEEREKTMNAMALERNKQMERRMHQKRLEVELIKEIRKPIDDMMLKNQKPLATLNRIPGLKLPGKAFADLLMSYEFLCNFGETVHLELKDVPDINTLQVGLLNLNTWAEDQLISLLHHLCMFAIKDPRFPYTGSTKEIENLERDNEGLSQLLHFYLQVITLNAKTDMEHECRLYKLIEQRYFLSLNATQKAEMLAFICNELLCSQTVTKQMEDTIENVAKLRKDKWVLENELRKYRVIKTKREQKEEAEQRAKESLANSSNRDGDMDDEEKLNDGKRDEDIATRPSLTNGSSAPDSSLNERDNDNDRSIQANPDLDDLEPETTNDELNRKIENLTRQYNKTSNKLERAINSMRANPLGQDRYRRRYWVLPQVGGVFVEGIESSEPEELSHNKFTEEELVEYEREMRALSELNSNEIPEISEDLAKGDIKTEQEDEDMDIKEDGEVKDDEEAMEIKEDEVEANNIKDEVKSESAENGEQEMDKGVVDGSSEENNPPMPTIPWFSILPRNSCDFFRKTHNMMESIDGDDTQKKSLPSEDNPEAKAELTDEELRAMSHEICPNLARRLDELKAEQYDSPKKIHPQFQFGWWRITDAQQLKSILSVLHERGSRERVLHKHLTKHFQYTCNSCKNSTVDFEITSYDRQLTGKNYGAPVPHTDEDSADDLKEGDEDDDDEATPEELDENTEDDRVPQQPTVAPVKKSKRKKGSASARARRLRARAAAKKKVENSRSKLTIR